MRGEDHYRNSNGKSVDRVILVHERDTSTRYVHIHLFTT